MVKAQLIWKTTTSKLCCFFFNKANKQTSASPKVEANLQSLECHGKGGGVLSASMKWLVVISEVLCPWHHSLRVKNCATRASKTNTSALIFIKRKKNPNNLLIPTQVPQFLWMHRLLWIDHSGSEYFFFFAKWEVALDAVDKEVS